MISKKLIITEHNGEQEYDYDFLFEGESEEKVDADILNYIKNWYGSNVVIEIGDEDACTIDFGFTSIKWRTFEYTHEQYVQELLKRHIMTSS